MQPDYHVTCIVVYQVLLVPGGCVRVYLGSARVPPRAAKPLLNMRQTTHSTCAQASAQHVRPIRALCSPLDLSSCATRPDSTQITYERSTPRYELLIYHTIRLTLNSRYFAPKFGKILCCTKKFGVILSKIYGIL